MDGGIDGGGGAVDGGGVDVDVVASLTQALSSSPMDSVVVAALWEAVAMEDVSAGARASLLI